MPVQHIDTKCGLMQKLAEFDKCISDSKEKLVVVDFTATWCGPCKRIAPLFEELAGKYPHVVFVKVDVDANQETAAACAVSSMPTFQFYKNGAKIHQFSGANAEELVKMIETHSGDKWSALGGGSTAGGGAAAPTPADPRAAAAAAAERRMAAMQQK